MIEPRDRYRNPALLVVDMQNDFVRVGAALEVADARATIPANRALIDFFRARKLPVGMVSAGTAADQMLLERAQASLSGHRSGTGVHRRHR